MLFQHGQFSRTCWLNASHRSLAKARYGMSFVNWSQIYMLYSRLLSYMQHMYYIIKLKRHTIHDYTSVSTKFARFLVWTELWTIGGHSYHEHPWPIYHLWPTQILANGRRHNLCKVSSHKPKSCKNFDRKWLPRHVIEIFWQYFIYH